MKTPSTQGFQQFFRKWQFIASLITTLLISSHTFAQVVEFDAPKPDLPAYQLCTNMQSIYADVYLKLFGFPQGDTNTVQFVVMDNGAQVKIETVHYNTSDTVVYRRLNWVPNGGAGTHQIIISMTTEINGVKYNDEKNYELSFGPQECVTISGKVARSGDNNCDLDPVDIGLANVKVDVYQGTVSTDPNGDYILHYPKNKTVSLSTPIWVFDQATQKYYGSDCPDGRSKTITTDVDQVVNFMYNKDSVQSATVNVSGYAYPPSSDNEYCSGNPQTITINLSISLNGFSGPANVIVQVSDNGMPLAPQSITMTNGWNSYQTQTITSPGLHQFIITVTANDGTSEAVGSYSVTAKFGPDYCKTMSGRVVFETDGNCEVNTGDLRLKDVVVDYGYGAVTTTTDANGEYQLIIRSENEGRIAVPKLSANGNGKYYGSDCLDGTEYFFTGQASIQHDFIYNKDDQSSDISGGYIYTWTNAAPCTLPAEYSFIVGFNSSVYPYTATIDFGDGTSFSKVINSQSDTISTIHLYTSAGTYHVRAAAVLPDTTAYAYLDDPIYLSSDCGNVEGYVFEDANSNCEKDGNEKSFSNLMVYLQSGARKEYQQPDANGHYSFQVPNGAPYTVKLADADDQGKIHSWWNNNLGYVSCPAKYEKSQPESNLNFGLSCSAGNIDYSVTGYAWRFRPGFEGVISMQARNFGCVSGLATLKLELENNETFNSANITPTRINGNVIEWDINDLNVYNFRDIKVYVQLAQNAVIGDSVCHNITITPTSGDAHPEDNMIRVCSEIRGSWDPNDKQVFIAGTAKNGSTMRATDALSYMIRFQNTGTDTAFNIYLLDTIDPSLDLRTFQLVSTSHQVKPIIGTDRVIRFEYNNILLPDDKTNEERSHGHVMYTLRPMNGLVPGNQIHNTAYIYFDFNEPVITNTTESEVVDASGIGNVTKAAGFSCYPNPANGQLNLKLSNGANSGSYKLVDMLGKVVMQGDLTAVNELNVSQLHTGIYMVQVEVKGEVSSVKLVVNH